MLYTISLFYTLSNYCFFFFGSSFLHYRSFLVVLSLKSIPLMNISSSERHKPYAIINHTYDVCHEPQSLPFTSIIAVMYVSTRGITYHMINWDKRNSNCEPILTLSIMHFFVDWRSQYYSKCTQFYFQDTFLCVQHRNISIAITSITKPIKLPFWLVANNMHLYLFSFTLWWWYMISFSTGDPSQSPS